MSLLNAIQKRQLMSSIHSGGQLVIKPTRTQQGAFLGTLLTSIGIPLRVKAITGGGLQVDRHQPKETRPVFVPTEGGLINPYAMPPPSYGT